MDRPYDSIPRQGEHLGSDLDEEPTTNVRAQAPANPTSDDSAAGGIIQCSYNEAAGHYRLRRWRNESEISPREGYEEVHRIPEGESPDEILGSIPHEARYIVLENVESGEIRYDRESELSNNWTADGRFDQVTVFDSEDAAARYVSSRQDES